MVDPLSVGVLGGVALSEGIKFLYGQVTELLKRRRDRAEQAAAAPPVVPAGLVEVLDAPLSPRPVNLEVVAGNEARLLELRRELGDYADGLATPDPADRRLLEVDASAEEMKRRREAWAPPPARVTAGVLFKYARQVSSASLGAVTDL